MTYATTGIDETITKLTNIPASEIPSFIGSLLADFQAADTIVRNLIDIDPYNPKSGVAKNYGRIKEVWADMNLDIAAGRSITWAITIIRAQIREIYEAIGNGEVA